MKTEIDTTIYSWFTLLGKLRDDLKKAFLKEIDDLQQFLGENKIEAPNWDFKELSVFSKWEKGLISTYQVCELLDRLDFDVVARSLLLYHLNQFQKSAKFEEKVADRIKDAIVNVEKLRSDYINYLMRTEQAFLHIADIEYLTAPLLFFHQKEDVCIIKEMYFNEAVRFIKKNNLQKIGEPAIYNELVLSFSPDKAHRLPSEKYWFVCPKKSYIDIFRMIFKVTTSFIRPNEDWISLLNDKINERAT